MFSYLCRDFQLMRGKGTASKIGDVGLRIFDNVLSKNWGSSGLATQVDWRKSPRVHFADAWSRANDKTNCAALTSVTICKTKGTFSKPESHSSMYLEPQFRHWPSGDRMATCHSFKRRRCRAPFAL